MPFSRAFAPALVALAAMALLSRSALAITVEAHNLNIVASRPHLDGQWLGMCYASDGNAYFGSSDHCAHEGAAFLKYDPRTHNASVLCSDITTLTGDDPYYYPQGKLHSNMVEANGWVYWATHWSNDQLPGGDSTYWHGSHFQGYCLATGEFRDYGVIHGQDTCYCAVDVDPARNYGYVYVCPVWAAGRIFRYDLATGAKTDLGLAGGGGNVFAMFADKRGDIWFSPNNDGGNFYVIRGATGAIERFPAALPPIYRWDRDELVSDSWYDFYPPAGGALMQTNRWASWMQPLGDGDRAVFTLGYYGGRLYTFDSTKDVASGAAFSSVAFIGFNGLGMAVCGNKVFYYQRANNGYYDQPLGDEPDNVEQTKDWHLLSCDLNPQASPQIVDYGTIVDGIGRNVWRVPSMMTDGAGSVFMTGDWWTDWLQPGVDDGTYRYRYDANHNPPEYYLKYERGEQFARADMPDLLTDDFDDNIQGAIWSVAEDDHAHVWVSESNQRLEICSSSSPTPDTASYQGHGWRVDTTRDFACRIDYHIDPASSIQHSVGLKVAANSLNHAGIFATYSAADGENWVVGSATAGVGFQSDPLGRNDHDGTFYISYDSITDTLYLSKTGYWRRADAVMGDWLYPGVVRGQWKATVLDVQIEGMVQGAAFSGDTAYFDNFVADEGVCGNCIMSVVANPETNVPIQVDAVDATGHQNGTTHFSRSYMPDGDVTLTAPSTAMHVDHTHNFIRWNVERTPQTPGQRSVVVPMSVNTVATAVYETATWTLNVESAPVSGAPISNVPEGVTPYAAQVNDASTPVLIAPASFAQGGKTWFFVGWVINGLPLTNGVRTASVTMWTDATAVATYRGVQSLRISGPTSIRGGARAKYRCAATFTSGSAKYVTASARWSENSPYLRFVKPGTLEAKRVSGKMVRTITAKYGGVSKNFRVTVRP